MLLLAFILHTLIIWGNFKQCLLTDLMLPLLFASIISACTGSKVNKRKLYYRFTKEDLLRVHKCANKQMTSFDFK